jgi:uncharacterized protein YuzE
MRIDYDPVADVIYFRFNNQRISKSVEMREGVTVDYDSGDHICGVEVLSYSRRSMDLNRLIMLPEEEIVSEVVAASYGYSPR